MAGVFVVLDNNDLQAVFLGQFLDLTGISGVHGSFRRGRPVTQAQHHSAARAH